jgi:hypothetical protein
MKQHDDDMKGSFKSGGQRIDDHAFWAGSKGKDSVFPDGPHKTKNESSAEGGGSVGHYEDTTETIRSQQEMSKKKMMAHPMKPGTRN